MFGQRALRASDSTRPAARGARGVTMVKHRIPQGLKPFSVPLRQVLAAADDCLKPLVPVAPDSLEDLRPSSRRSEFCPMGVAGRGPVRCYGHLRMSFGRGRQDLPQGDPHRIVQRDQTHINNGVLPPKTFTENCCASGANPPGYGRLPRPPNDSRSLVYARQAPMRSRNLRQAPVKGRLFNASGGIQRWAAGPRRRTRPASQRQQKTSALILKWV